MNASQERVLSGFRPSGPLHIGHWVGALQNWVSLQRQYRCFYAVCDWHALTSEYAHTASLRDYVHQMALDWLPPGWIRKSPPCSCSRGSRSTPSCTCYSR